MNKLLLFLCTACIMVACTSLVFGLPVGEQTSAVPAGDTSGGAGSLLPSYDFGAKTSAAIVGDPKKTPAGLAIDAKGKKTGIGGIMSMNDETTSVDDSVDFVYEIEEIGEGVGVKWSVELSGSATGEAHTLNAPCNPRVGYYSVDTSCKVWFHIKVNGTQVATDSQEGIATIRNNQSGMLSTLASVNAAATRGNPGATGAIDLVPLNIAGGRATITLKYGVMLGVSLDAQRDGVGVGGKASGSFDNGYVKAWGYPLRGVGDPYVLKKPSGDDAVWELN